MMPRSEASSSCPPATPAVSVLMPVYNGERAVAAAIQSIQTQTLADWELLVLDDGSTDDSLEICQAQADGDPRIRVLRHTQNRGLAAAMNTLVAEAKADLMAVQEQDDRSVPGRLAAQVAYLDGHPEVGLVSGVARWMDGDTEVALFPGRLARGEPYPLEMVEYLLVEQCKVVNACTMFRRRCLPEGAPAFDEGARMSIDWQFFVDVAHRDRIAGIPEVLVEMDRSSERASVTADKTLQAAEARRFLRIARRRYLHDPSSPVTRSMLRRAWAAEVNLEARWRGGAAGLGMVVVAMVLDPSSDVIRASARDFISRAVGRGVIATKELLAESDFRPLHTRWLSTLLRPHAIKQLLVSREIAALRADSSNGLFLGSAGQQLDGLVSCDLFDERADLQVDATDLSIFDDGSIDYIEHHHMIEHLPIDSVELAMNEWHRVLRPGGHLVITCPDFDGLARLWRRTRSDTDRAKVARMVYGPQNHEGQFHRSAHTPRSLRLMAVRVGFEVSRSYTPYPRRSTPSQLLIARMPLRHRHPPPASDAAGELGGNDA